MSVVIQGIEMPQSCLDCPCHDGEYGRCNITKNYIDFDVNSILRDCPLKEAEPVLHAHWIWYAPSQYGCSNCEYSSHEYHKYCPHCGAKMDGEEK